MRNIFPVLIFGFALFAAGCSQNPTSNRKAQDASTQQGQPSEARRHDISAEEAKKLLETGQEVVVLDVRTPEEFNKGHVRGARNIDFYKNDFAQELESLDPSKTYLLYCASGNRSGKTAAMLEEKDFQKIYNSKAGFSELKSTGVPTE